MPALLMPRPGGGPGTVGRDPVLCEKLNDMGQSLSTLCERKAQAHGISTPEYTDTLPKMGVLHPLVGLAAAGLLPQRGSDGAGDAAAGGATSTLGGAAGCNRCSILHVQMRALAQSLAGLGAHVYNWSTGLSMWQRRALAELILDFTRPCMHLDPRLLDLCVELERLQKSGDTPSPPSPPWSLTHEPPGRPVDEVIGHDPLPLTSGRPRGPSLWRWWDADMATYIHGGPVKERPFISEGTAAREREPISSHRQIDESDDYEPPPPASGRVRGPSIWKWWDADMGTFGHGGPIKEALVEDLEGLIQTLNQRQFTSRKPPHYSAGPAQDGQSIADSMGTLPPRAPGLPSRPLPQPLTPMGTSQQTPAPKVIAADMTIQEMDALAIETSLRRLRASFSGHSTLLQH